MTVPLSAGELDAINRPTGAAHGLPNRCYTSPEVARAECDAVLARTWTAIAFASALAPGDARPIDLMGQPLMILRDPGGTIRVFHNVCRHRGHRLVSSPCRIKGAIRCPYHSWTYGFDGALRGTPHIGGHGVHEVDGFDKSRRGLFEVRSAIWLDVVFVNLSGTAVAFAEYIEPLVRRWEPFVGPGGLDTLRPASPDERLELEVGCNWKLAVENYCESYHLPWVHPGLNSYSRLEDHYNIVADGWGAGQGSRAFAFTERAGIRLPRFRRWPSDQLKIAEYIALFPNLLVGLQNDHFFALVLKPLEPGRTLESIQIYYVGEAAVGEEYDAARRIMREGWREVFTEDVNVCEEMQRGRASPVFDGGAFSPALDVATHAFHRWMAQRLNEGAGSRDGES